jgi:predicted nucleic acid-binding protein
MFSAFFDANVLVPITLADTILSLADWELFKPFWSQRVLNETKAAILEIHPGLPESRIDYRLQHMQRAFPEACVSGYENLESLIELPDPDDRHVVAAAQKAGADLLVCQRRLKSGPFSAVEKCATSFLSDSCS